jgi:nucleoside-diphosphate-sugar epimerase
VEVVVVGARGFIGSAIVDEVRARGWTAVARRATDSADVPQDAIVVYASGLASRAAEQPAAAFQRHVIDAARWTAVPHRRFVYISSTRVYDAAPSTNEVAALPVLPGRTDSYVASKLAGEAFVLAVDQRAVVARLSNVAGPSVRSELFLSDILRTAAQTGTVRLRSGLDSAKDYIDVRDVATWVADLADAAAPPRIVNLAFGQNITHRAWLEGIARCLPLRVDVAPASPTIVVPAIDTAVVQGLFPRRLRDPLAELPSYVRAFQAAQLARS